MKHGLVLPGGAFRGGVQTGFVKFWAENKRFPDLVTGTSVGALVGALVAMGKYDVLFDLWCQVGESNGGIITTPHLAELRDGGVHVNANKIEDILTNDIGFFDKVGLITKKGRKKLIDKVIQNGLSIDRVMDNGPLGELLLKHVKKADFKVPFYFTIVSLNTGSLYTLGYDSFMTDRDLAKAILASSTMPGLWAPVDKIQLADGQYIFDVVDGGLRSSSPLSQCFNEITFEDPWTISVPNPNNIAQLPNVSSKNLITQAALSVSILLNENLSRDIKQATKWNNLALKYPEMARAENIKYAKLLNIEAPFDMFGRNSLGNPMDPRPEWIERRIEIGYNLARIYFAA